MIRTLRLKFGDDTEETTLLSKLMAYCSKEAHSCVEKAAMIGFVKLRILEPDENCSLRGHTLREVNKLLLGAWESFLLICSKMKCALRALSPFTFNQQIKLNLLGLTR